MIYIFAAIILIGIGAGIYALRDWYLKKQDARDREQMREALRKNIEQDIAQPPS